MRKPIYEIIDKVKTTNSKEEKQRILKENATQPFLEILKYAFHPDIKFYPKAFPSEYKKPDTFPGISISDLGGEIRRLYLFERGNPVADSLSEEKRKILLLQMLESFEPEEATLLINTFNKKVPGLTYKLIKETFPTLLP